MNQQSDGTDSLTVQKSWDYSAKCVTDFHKSGVSVNVYRPTTTVNFNFEL